MPLAVWIKKRKPVQLATLIRQCIYKGLARSSSCYHNFQRIIFMSDVFCKCYTNMLRRFFPWKCCKNRVQRILFGNSGRQKKLSHRPLISEISKWNYSNLMVRIVIMNAFNPVSFQQNSVNQFKNCKFIVCSCMQYAEAQFTKDMEELLNLFIFFKLSLNSE